MPVPTTAYRSRATRPRYGDAIDDRLYFRQLLSGRDFAVGDPVGAAMRNYVYLLGDRHSGECVVVDPAYAVGEILDAAAADGMRIVGALATHYHPDHVGGAMMGHAIEGAAELVARHDVPIHVHADEAPWVTRVTGLGADQLVAHAGGDEVRVGGLSITLLHTPGHTPGSQCFLVEGCLVAGDTLFLDGCGRTDLPGGDAGQLHDSLRTLSRLPEGTLVCPGHAYSEMSTAPLGDVVRTNVVFAPRTREEWMRAFGR
jgi:glyoxylase-like metal-dependent hydrolase (beta-lactamase superfamily II)